MTDESLIGIIEREMKKRWDYPALRNNKKEILRYRDVARIIEKMHLIFEAASLRCGERVALCDSDDINWSVLFLSITTYGAVPVLIEASDPQRPLASRIKESGAKLLFTAHRPGEHELQELGKELQAIFAIEEVTLLYAKDEKVRQTRERLNELFCKKYPMEFLRGDIGYRHEQGGDTFYCNARGEGVSFANYSRQFRKYGQSPLFERLFAPISQRAVSNVAPGSTLTTYVDA